MTIMKEMVVRKCAQFCLRNPIAQSGSNDTISPKEQKKADEIFGVSDEFTSEMTIGFES